MQQRVFEWFITYKSIAISTSLLLLMSCAAQQQSRFSESASPIPVGKSSHTILSGNKKRHFLLYLPASYDEKRPVPLVLNFHGSGSNPQRQLDQSDLARVAESNGFIVVLPAGVYRSYGRASWNTILDPDGVNDIQLITDLIAALGTRLSIDQKRIYVTGMSGGGRMTSRAACELADILAAAAPVAGVQYLDNCSPSRPIPIMTFHGKADRVNQYEHQRNSPKLWVTGVEESVARWVNHNECDKTPHTTQVAGVVTKLNWQRCRGGAEVVLYRIEDGGHTWPGSPIIKTGVRSGKTNTDINASELLWGFFSKHPLP